MNQTTQLLIARHGNTFGPNDTVRRVGKTDLPLVETGLIQGERLGHYLKKNYLIPDVIFTSELQRTQQTAQMAQKAMESELVVQPLSIFNEIDYGPDENQPESQVVSRIGQEALKAWEEHATVPAGWNFDPQQTIQNWQQFANQIETKYPGKRILVVTSNGIARFAPYLTGNFEQFCKEHAIKISTGALCIFEKNQNATTWNCNGWNIKPHD